VAIRSFAREEVRDFFISGRVGRREGWATAASIVARKLDMIEYASELRDLRSPPGNRLEAMQGSWLGFYSMRINDQWRIVFRWSKLGAELVDLVDYH